MKHNMKLGNWMGNGCWGIGTNRVNVHSKSYPFCIFRLLQTFILRKRPKTWNILTSVPSNIIVDSEKRTATPRWVQCETICKDKSTCRFFLLNWLSAANATTEEKFKYLSNLEQQFYPKEQFNPKRSYSLFDFSELIDICTIYGNHTTGQERLIWTRLFRSST